MKNMSQFVINDKKTLKEKVELVQNLGEIEIAHKIVTRGTAKAKANQNKTNPLDDKYDALNCKISTMNTKDKEYKLIADYLKST